MRDRRHICAAGSPPAPQATRLKFGVPADRLFVHYIAKTCTQELVLFVSSERGYFTSSSSMSARYIFVTSTFIALSGPLSSGYLSISGSSLVFICSNN